MDLRQLTGDMPGRSLPQQVVSGYVSRQQPAPAGMTDTLYVVIPSHSTEISTPVKWSQDHGVSLPQPGASVLLAKDYQDDWRCVWWDGAYVSPPTSGSGPSTFITSVTAANLNTAISTVSGERQSLIIDLPQGDFDLTGTTINAASTYNITLRGQGSSYGGTRLKTNSTSGAIINAQCAGGFRLEGIALWAENASFTGPLLDLGTTGIGTPGAALARIRDCNLTAAANGVNSCTLLDLNNALGCLIEGTYFIGGGRAIVGAHGSSYWSNAHTIHGACWFQQQTSAAIQDLTQQALITGCIFEPLYSGEAGAYFQDPGVPSQGLSFRSNYVADVSSSGGNFVVVYGDATVIDGNIFETSTAGYGWGVVTNGNCNGLSVQGNKFNGLVNALYPNTGSHTRVVYLDNTETAVTTPIATMTTLGAGSIIDSAGTLYAKGGITSF